jgi:hypothetical protein
MENIQINEQPIQSNDEIHTQIFQSNIEQIPPPPQKRSPWKFILIPLGLFVFAAIIIGSSMLINSKNPIAPTAPQIKPKAVENLPSIQPTLKEDGNPDPIVDDPKSVEETQQKSLSKLSTGFEQKFDLLPENPSNASVLCADGGDTIINNAVTPCSNIIIEWNTPIVKETGVTITGYNVYFGEEISTPYWSPGNKTLNLSNYLPTELIEGQIYLVTPEKLTAGKKYVLYVQTVTDSKTHLLDSGGFEESSNQVRLANKVFSFTYVP